MSDISISDGANSIGGGSCQDQPTCTISVQWHATGLSGQHSLTATASTDSDLSATSAAVVVNVVSPAPTVSVTSPATGATVSGKVAVNVSAATDASQDDYPTAVSVNDGVNSLGGFGCQGQQTCQGVVNWDTTGLSGQHTLTATVQTNRGLSVTSAPTTITIVSPGPTVKIVSPTSGAELGRVITIKVSGQTDPSQTDYPTSITVYDGSNSIGDIGCEGQQTCSGSLRWDARGLHGRHVLKATIGTNRGASGTSDPVVVGVAAKHSVSIHCTLSTTSAKLHQRVSGQCSFSGAPVGTGVSILYAVGGTFHVIGTARVPASGTVPFHISSSTPITIALWAELNSTATTNAARVKIGTVRIHG